MAEDTQAQSQKTEEPTQKRLREAREQGQVAQSREVNTWLMLAGASLLIYFVMPHAVVRIATHLSIFLDHPDILLTDPGGLTNVTKEAFLAVALILAFPFGVLMLLAFLGPVMQNGIKFTPKSMEPKWSKLSPLKGVKRLFSLKGLSEFAKGLVKLALVVGLTYVVLRPVFHAAPSFVGITLPAIMQDIHWITMILLISCVGVMLIVAILDFMYQKMDLKKQLRMSKQDIKEEMKQSEGDPKIKARLSKLRYERARNRMMQNVPQADVVITNPTHYAVALKYDRETMRAPVCVAKGMDNIALKIREIAEENKVVIMENPPLARGLHATVEIDDEIPEEHYQAVAEIISYVFGLKQAKGT